jgi:hypothetical protein
MGVREMAVTAAGWALERVAPSTGIPVTATTIAFQPFLALKGRSIAQICPNSAQGAFYPAIAQIAETLAVHTLLAFARL